MQIMKERAPWEACKEDTERNYAAHSMISDVCN